jgi:hypothetical protein
VTERNYYDNAYADAEIIDVTQWGQDHVIYKQDNAKQWSIDDIAYLSDSAVGDNVCKTGYRTKKSCAEINSLHYHSEETGGCDPCIDLLDQRRALITFIANGETYGVDHGDSGAAVYIDSSHRAEGILNPLHNGHAAFVYTQITIVLQELIDGDSPYPGLQVCTSQDGYGTC